MDGAVMVTCPQCGEQNPEGTKFCGNCGARLGHPAPGTQESHAGGRSNGHPAAAPAAGPVVIIPGSGQNASDIQPGAEIIVVTASGRLRFTVPYFSADGSASRSLHTGTVGLGSLALALPSIPVPTSVLGVVRAKTAGPVDDTSVLAPLTLILDRYLCIGVIAEGGAGRVYLFLDIRLRRWVAMKTVKNPTDADAAEATSAERLFLGRVRHEGVASIYDIIAYQGVEYSVVSYIAGKTLAQLCKQQGGSLPIGLAMAIASQVGQTVSYLIEVARLGVGDNTINNWIVDPRGHVILIDIGGAWDTTARNPAAYGVPGCVAPEITPDAPEILHITQEQYFKTIPPALCRPTVASEVFALGALLKQLLYGTVDFEPQDYFTPLAFGQQDPRSVAISSFQPLLDWLTKAMAFLPGRRFRSVAEAATQLDHVLTIYSGSQGTPKPYASDLFAASLVPMMGEELALQSLPLPVISLDPEAPNARVIDSIMALPDRLEAYRRLAGLPDFVKNVDATTAAAIILITTIAGAKDEHALIRQVHLSERPLDQALAFLAALPESDHRRLYLEGLVALARKDAQSASRSFEAVIKEYPGELAAYLAAGTAAERAGNWTSAADRYRLVQAADPDELAATAGLARVLAASGTDDSVLEAGATIEHSAAQGRPLAVELSIGVLEAALAVCEAGTPLPGKQLLGVPFDAGAIHGELHRLYSQQAKLAQDRKKAAMLFNEGLKHRQVTLV